MSNPGFNKVLLIGNAGQDAEAKSTSNGKRVANFSLTINSSFHKEKGGRGFSGWNGCDVSLGANKRKSQEGS